MCSLFDIDLKKIQAYAHSKRNGFEKELFHAHCERTLKYYRKIVDIYNLTEKYTCMLRDIDSESSINFEKVINLLEQIVLFHDCGKLTKLFQKKLDGNDNNETHSDKSFAVITYALLRLNRRQEINNKEFLVLFLISYSTLKHHGRLNDLLDDIESFKTTKKSFSEVFDYLNEKPDDSIIDIVCNEKFWRQWKKHDSKELINKLSTQSLSFFILLKTVHSTLISADYWATTEYTSGCEFELSYLDGETRARIIDRFNNDESIEENFNPSINRDRDELSDLDIEAISWETNQDKAAALNKVRSYLNIIAEEKMEEILRKHPQENVFFLNVPTGGGKTNLSLRLATWIFEMSEIRKIFYVFPFINLIEQSFDLLGKFIGIKNMVRLDSRYVPEDKEYSDDDIYARYIENQFMNHPALFLSHVKFFDMFFRNDKNSNYNFHQLANSIVIIDEIQAYSDEVWTEMANVFNSLGRFLNTYFIVMSATLPAIDNLIKGNLIKSGDTSFQRLLDDEISAKVFRHPVFQRAEIKPEKNLSIRDKDGKLQKKKIVNAVKKYVDRDKILFVVNKVDDSLKIYEAFADNEKKWEGHRVLLLNSTITDTRRKKILKMCHAEGTKILLISTQSVEAGVDIDFDVGFRAYSPLDSIVQVAGRINRNNKKDMCELIVFKDDAVGSVYRGNTKSRLSTDKDFIYAFFDKKLFNEEDIAKKYYRDIVEKIKEKNKNTFLQSSESNISDMVNLFYKQVDRNVHLIKGDTISVFVPYDSTGEKLWGEYKGLFPEKKGFTDIIKIREKRKELAPYIINVFNAWTQDGALKNILHNEMMFGFYYFKDWKKNDCYSVEKGLDVKEFRKIAGMGKAVFL